MPWHRSIFSPQSRPLPVAATWLICFAALLAAVVLRILGQPFSDLPLIPLFLAVVVAAYIGGIWTGLAATLAGLGFDWLFPSDAPAWAPYGQRIVAYLIACAIVVLISELLHRARRKAETALGALHESESRFTTFMRNLSAAAWTVDLDGKYTFMNEAGLCMLGKTLPDILGRPYREIIPAEMAAICDRNDRQAISLGSVVVSEEVVDLAGHTYGLLVSKFPLYLRGQLAGIGGVAIDVTDRHRAEQALAASHRQLQLIADGLPAAVASFDKHGRLQFINREFREWCGIGNAEIVGKTLEECGRAVLSPLRELVDEALRGERGRVEMPLRVRDGQRWADCAAVPQFNGGSAVRDVLLLINDITERRSLEDQRAEILDSERAARAEAERANRIKDEFLATISHELRTPLNAILGWITLVQRGLTADFDQAIAVIERNARAEALLIDDLLDMGRILVGKLRLQMEVVDVHEIVRSAVGVVRPAAEARRIALNLHTQGVDGEYGNVRADPARLQQILWNLLSNAIKFTPVGGSIDVSVNAASDQWQIEVRDNGKGIEPSFLPFVFDRFRQADGTTRRTSGGLGLGLAIVKYLVELHGGTIEAESAGAGKGATFRLQLPRTLAPTPTRRRAETGTVSLRGARVLVVDDDADAVEIARRFLQDREAEIYTASTADEAIKVASEFPPDVIVTDIGMPGDDGFDLIRRIQQLDEQQGTSTPVVAMTAYVRPADRERIRQAGFFRHVPKPVDPAELCNGVAMACAASVRAPRESRV